MNAYKIYKLSLNSEILRYYYTLLVLLTRSIGQIYHPFALISSCNQNQLKKNPFDSE